MSDTSAQDVTPDADAMADNSPAKKTTKAKAAKKTAKKAARKTAKKAAKKTTKSAKKAAKKTTRKRKEASAAENSTTEKEKSDTQMSLEISDDQTAQEPQEGEQPKVGRVKGLGPVKRSGDKKESSEDNEADQPSSEHPRGRYRDKRGRHPKKKFQKRERKPIEFTSDPVEINGMLEIAPKGFGFLRVPEKNFEQCKKDVFVPPDYIRKHGLRPGVWIHGMSQDGPRGPQLTSLTKINELPPEEAFKLPHFDELKAVNPTRRIAFETTPERFTTRVLDIISPVGRGQRGLIVSPPRSGKTTLLLHMAEAIREKYDESIHLIILLVDERPEEVTEFKRALPNAEIYASSNDDGARNHTRLSEMCIERAKRLVESGEDVLILMDSITRLARAYNNSNRGGKGRGYQSGGIVAGALEMPRRLFAAARDTRNAGSLTILATALIQTNSRADEAIFQEFKGTGNMELVLDRRIAEQYIYPAVDIFKSGTRREELIMAEHQLHKINLIRRGLAGHRPEEAMERLIFFLKKFPNNAQMLMEIKG